MLQRINLAHGEGGELTNMLIKDVFEKAFGHAEHTKHDSAIFQCKPETIALTTDSYVVKPLFFPGGNIGKLAVAGTVNDLAVSGAVPKFMTAGFIIEEGLPLKDLKEIVHSMADEAEKQESGSLQETQRWSKKAVQTGYSSILPALEQWRAGTNFSQSRLRKAILLS